ncbi:MAG: type II toxin-antitoxin system HicB family antitoxin [Methylococcaceae bacterium]|nr:MAG: type II toxin-antitoxin system HicB family antitoxin [Methylococcaceae bacterium]
MICDYIRVALEKAHYDLIDDEEPYYGEVPELPGVWATGKTLEECRRKLAEVIEGWILVRTSRGLKILDLAGVSIQPVREMDVA